MKNNQTPIIGSSRQSAVGGGAYGIVGKDGKHVVMQRFMISSNGKTIVTYQHPDHNKRHGIKISKT